MEVNIWNIKAGKYQTETKVKSIYNSFACNYFKLRYNDNTEKKFNAEKYRFDHIYSDDWKKEAY